VEEGCSGGMRGQGRRGAGAQGCRGPGVQRVQGRWGAGQGRVSARLPRLELLYGDGRRPAVRAGELGLGFGLGWGLGSGSGFG